MHSGVCRESPPAARRDGCLARRRSRALALLSAKVDESDFAMSCYRLQARGLSGVGRLERVPDPWSELAEDLSSEPPVCEMGVESNGGG